MRLRGRVLWKSSWDLRTEMASRATKQRFSITWLPQSPTMIPLSPIPQEEATTNSQTRMDNNTNRIKITLNNRMRDKADLIRTLPMARSFQVKIAAKIKTMKTVELIQPHLQMERPHSPINRTQVAVAKVGRLSKRIMDI